jgi:hypothetical protein
VNPSFLPSSITRLHTGTTRQRARLDSTLDRKHVTGNDFESCQEVPRRARPCSVRYMRGCSFSALEVQVQFPTCLFCFVGSNLHPILLAELLLAAYFASKFCQALVPAQCAPTPVHESIFSSYNRCCNLDGKRNCLFSLLLLFHHTICYFDCRYHLPGRK